MKRAYADIPEGQVHYRIDGEGYPVLLLHQSPASSAEYAEVMAVLSRSYLVVAMDTMGYGMSDRPAPGVTVADYARHAGEFLDTLRLGPVHLVAHHTGATIALELTLTRPALVNKLVLSGYPYYTPEMWRAQLEAAQADWPLRPAADGSHAMDLWNALRKYNPGTAPELSHRTLTSGLLSGERREDGHLAILRYPEQERLPLLKHPTLLLCGSNDPFFPHLEATRRLIPHCATKVIAGGTSNMILARAQEFAAAVAEFLGG